MEQDKKIFSYEYSASRQEEINQIRRKYIPKEATKMDELRIMDKKAENAGLVPALAAGILGILIFGTGMCCILIWADTLFVPGIIIGIIGLALMGAAYPLNNMFVKKKRAELAPQILKLTEELMK